MKMRSYALRFMESLTNKEAKPKNKLSYADWVNKYLANLDSGSIDFGVQTIVGSLSKCIDKVRLSQDEHLSVHKREISNPDYFLASLTWAIDTTIKERRYSRLKTALLLETTIDLADEISNTALSLPYDDMVDFMGELTGAWILTYPIDSIIKYDHDTSAAEWAKEEVDYIYILRRQFDVEFDEWRR